MMGSPAEEHDAVIKNYGYWAYETLHKVTLTQPFYCAVFELTGQQHDLIMGGGSTDYNSKTGLSYDYLRGSTLGAKWPEHQQVDAASLIGKLRSRTGITIDLPTEAQWEYACRAGDTRSTSGNPNTWGLYGMNATPAEWCLDWLKMDLGIAPDEDPKGPTSGDSGCRVLRGGVYCQYYGVTDVRSAARVFRNCGNSSDASYTRPTVGSLYYGGNQYLGCRLVALPAAK